MIIQTRQFYPKDLGKAWVRMIVICKLDSFKIMLAEVSKIFTFVSRVHLYVLIHKS